ncbi:hypothetical protein PHYC_00630 [Phycisphaerales bacterium]|nr:hypothetical protein PHYC_00630 [Phycisphaerales bacterium]
MTLCTSGCGSEIPINVRICPACGMDNACPNVRAASQPAEVDALDHRYSEALNRAAQRGTRAIVLDFQAAVDQSVAVNALSLDEAERILKASNKLFQTFAARISAGSQSPCTTDYYDMVRPRVEALLFPYYGQEIRFAALSLTYDGLTSFGPIALILSEQAIACRSTVLEDNSVHFFQDHKTDLLADFPPGYRATWSRRGMLAVAKLADQISGPLDRRGYHNLLLHHDATTGREHCIEVHIFGACNLHTVNIVRGPKRFRRNADQVRWNDLQYRAHSHGLTVELTP